jgi:hypothetical protein
VAAEGGMGTGEAVLGPTLTERGEGVAGVVDMAAIIALDALLFRFPLPIPSSSPSWSSAPLLWKMDELILRSGGSAGIVA